MEYTKEQLEQANKWFAEKCDIPLSAFGEHYTCKSINDEIVRWSILDPRCREIIREKFEIDTIRASYDKGIARNYWYSKSSQYPLIEGQGKTLEAAEIACMMSIYKLHRLKQDESDEKR